MASACAQASRAGGNSPAPAEDEAAQPISIRKLDRLETTEPSATNGR